MMGAGKRVRPDDVGRVPIFTSTGCYPVFCVVEHLECRVYPTHETWCPECANRAAWAIPTEEDNEGDEGLLLFAFEVNYERQDLRCEQCDERIESAYAEDGEDS